MTEYVLVSQGMEIYRTTNKQEAEEIMLRENENNSNVDCITGEPLVNDTTIYLYEERGKEWLLI